MIIKNPELLRTTPTFHVTEKTPQKMKNGAGSFVDVVVWEIITPHYSLKSEAFKALKELNETKPTENERHVVKTTPLR
jgi:tRNA A58 N-methylase Trm61